MRRLLRILWRVFKGVLISAAILVFLLAAGAFVVLKWPQVVINEPVFRQLAKVSGRFGWVVTWRDANISVHSKNILQKKLDFAFDDFCAYNRDQTYRACFDRLRVAGELAWLNGGLEILELGPLIMKAGEVKVTLPETPADPQKEPGLVFLPIPKLLVPERLSHTRFQEISLDFKEIKIVSGDDPPISVKAHLQGEPDERHKIHEIAGKIESGEVGPLRSATVELSLSSESGFSENDWRFDTKNNVTLTNGARISGPVRLQLENPERYRIGGDLNYQDGGQVLQLSLGGSLEPGKISARLQGIATGMAEEVKSVSLQPCSLDWQQQARNHRRADLTYHCRIEVVPGKIKISDEALKNYIDIPTHIKITASGNTNLELIPGANDPLSGQLKLKIDNIPEGLVTFEGEADVDFAGVPAQYPRGWKLVSTADVSVLLNSFQKLKRTLEKTPYAIPAPFNVFTGEVEFQVKGMVDIAGFQGILPVTFATRLSSPEQTFNTEGKGELKYKYSKKADKSHLTLDLALSDVKLMLPTVKIESPPKLLPDGRYAQDIPEINKVQAPSDFTYEVKVHTTEGAPVKLYSNLARGPIPLNLDITAVPEKTTGTVSVGDTRLEVFRRVGQVRKMILTLADPTEKSTVNGVVGVNYSDYDIEIQVVGPVLRPRVYFTSSPPLDREQIISLLIYGRTFEDLNQDESQSVGAVSGAVTDRALALGTLYFLASTPIESLGYNPNTGEFSAKVRLAKGTSLTLGTREGKSQKVGLRQGLGGNWSLSTFVENDSETGEQSGGGMIEWFKRY